MTDAAATSSCTPETDPLAGTAYRTVRRIGAGAMGQVFEAEHRGLRRRVAVKLLGPDLAGDPVFVDRLRLEAQALAAVRHPHVVTVHDHALTPAGVPFLVMELLEGRTLHDLLRERGTIPVPEALHLIDQIFGGLAALHAAGLIHRDLKPANIFLCVEQGRTSVKLLDFGIVKVTSPERAGSPAPLRYPTDQGHMVGTPRFMAPEQILGRPCDVRTDVYAAGVLLYLLLSGRDPFHHHRTHASLLSAHVLEVPPALSAAASQRIPGAVEVAVARALAKDPAHRFASILDFGAALGGRVVAPSAARPATTTEKLAPRNVATQKTEPLSLAWFRPAPGSSSAPVSSTSPAPAASPTTAKTTAKIVTPAHAAPSFGLPPADEAPGAGPPAGRLANHRLLLATVALLWCLVAVVAWRVL